MSAKTDVSSGNRFPEWYKNIPEEELREYSRRILATIDKTGTKDHYWMEKGMEYKYKAINESRKLLTYSQDWPAYNKAQQKEKLMVMNLLSELLTYITFKEDKGVGRNPVSMSDRLFYLAMLAYNQKSSRRCISDLEIAKKLNYITKVPHFNTVLKIQKDPDVVPYLTYMIEVSGVPLKQVEQDFAVDSSGFSTSEYGRWFDVRTGTDSEKRKYVKVHLTCGVKTNIITALNITEGTVADSPQFIPLIRKTNCVFDIKEVSADKAYISRDNLEYVDKLGGIAFIPFKSNMLSCSVHPHGFVWSKMLRFFQDYPQEFYHHYHKRSNVESTFNMLKRKFGSHLRSRSAIGQKNELMSKCLCHNLCVLTQEAFELGIDIEEELKKCADIPIAHNWAN